MTTHRHSEHVGPIWQRESALNLTWGLSAPRIDALEYAEQIRDRVKPLRATATLAGGLKRWIDGGWTQPVRTLATTTAGRTLDLERLAGRP